MDKRWVILMIICLSISLQGCETVKGASHGFKEGFKKDIENSKGLDAWMKENLW